MGVGAWERVVNVCLERIHRRLMKTEREAIGGGQEGEVEDERVAIISFRLA